MLQINRSSRGLFMLLYALLAYSIVCAEEPIKVGAILQLSGGNSQYGEAARRGIDLAAALINRGGGVGGRPFVIVYEDSKSQPAVGVSALQKLIAVHGVRAFLSQASPVRTALAPLCEQHRVLQMDVGSTTLNRRLPHGYTFRTAITAVHLAPALAAEMIARGARMSSWIWRSLLLRRRFLRWTAS